MRLYLKKTQYIKTVQFQQSKTQGGTFLNSNTKALFFTAFSSFLLSSQIIYNPLYKSSHRIVSSICLFIVGTVIILLVSSAFEKLWGKKLSCNGFTKAIGIINALFLSAAASLYVESFIRDAGQFSKFYIGKANSLFFIIILIIVCCFAAFKSTGGIIRLCCLCFAGFVIYFAIMFAAFSTLGKAIPPDKPIINSPSSQTLKDAVLSPLYLFSDISVFLFAAISENKTHEKIINRKVSGYSFYFCLFLLIINCIRAVLMFGGVLASEMYSCDLTSLRLISGFGFSEIYLFATGFACIIKLSVYFFAASEMIKPQHETLLNSTICHALPPVATLIFLFIKNAFMGEAPLFSTALFGIISVVLLILPIIFMFASSKVKKTG